MFNLMNRKIKSMFGEVEKPVDEMVPIVTKLVVKKDKNRGKYRWAVNEIDNRTVL